MASAHGGGQLSDDASEWAPDWWVEHHTGKANGQATSAGHTESMEEVELVEKGVKEWVSTNEESPDWFTINEEDELKYKPHGAFTTESAELCLPTSIKVGKATVGIEACHYGGCEWEVNACLAACIGTGMNDSCSGYYSLSGDIGVVNADLSLYPEGEMLGTALILTSIKMTGELCYYYVTGSDCKTASYEFDFY